MDKLLKRKSNFENVLASQNCVFGRAGLGFNPQNKQDNFSKLSVKQPIVKSKQPVVTCFYCMKRGHSVRFCKIRKYSVPRGFMKWIPKSCKVSNCSVRLTYDVFVRDLNRQLGTPSHWLPVDSCKKRTKGCPSGRLHSDAQVSQQETPKLCTSVSEHRVWHSEGGKKNCVSCVYSRSGKQPLFQSLVRSLTTSSKQLECIMGKFAKTSNPVPNILSAI